MPEDFGDRRWLRVQEQIMNLVTAERTDQQDLASLKAQVGKLADHIEDLDDHLRGVAGHDSLDSRVVLLEREGHANSMVVRDIRKQLDDVKETLSGIKLHRSMSKEFESTRSERFTAWLKFWGPIILASISLVIPLAKLAFEYKAKQDEIDAQYRPDEKLRRQIELDKRSQRAKVVKKKLRTLEKIQETRP